jgi:WD40 repeat protein
MYHRGAIESYPLQTYVSALLFSPKNSLIRRLFKHEELKEITIQPAMSDNWSACLQTLEGHSDSVNSVAFSPDSSRLASASGDSTVKIWDASSGTCLQTLEGQGSADLISILASLHSSITVMKPQQPAHQKTMISVESPWIFNNAQKLFWLPTEYRSCCSAVSGRYVGVGTGSGKIWICCFY